MTHAAPTLAVLGAGMRGRVCYGGFLESNPERGRVVAVAEPRDFARNDMALRHTIKPKAVFSDWRDLLDQPRLADIALIATLDRDHAQAAIRAAELGYHILLEKPMAPTAIDCVAIRDAAKHAMANGPISCTPHVGANFTRP